MPIYIRALFILIVLPMLLLAALISFFQTSTIYADPTTTIYRVAKTGNAPADGLSWTNAYTDVQDALNAANPGDEIWVASGIYTPGITVTDTFQLKDSVALYGGFAATETMRIERDWVDNPTILSGDIESNDATDADGVITSTIGINGNNSYHVVNSSGVTNTAILDGFTITGGQANGPETDPCDSRCGGGQYNVSGSPTINNVRFSGNSAYWYGGGLYNSGGSNPSLSEVIFSGNTVTFADGGGMFNGDGSNPTLNNVTFSGNSAASAGGGMINFFTSTNVTLANVTFSGNSAAYTGGGMVNYSKATLTNVTFNDNSASESGGGMINNSPNATLISVIFSGNTAGGEGSGGGMANSVTHGGGITLTNITFINNSAGRSGGGMSNSSGEFGRITLNDITFIDNSAEINGGGMVNTVYLDNFDIPPPNEFLPNIILTDANFISNSAGSSGGGMYNFVYYRAVPKINDASGNLSGTTLSEISNDGHVVLSNASFSGNSAGESGGGLFNRSQNTFTGVANLTVLNTSFSGNTAGKNGGGLFDENLSFPGRISLILANASLNGNLAGESGGGMFNENINGRPTVYNSIFWGNSDSSGIGTLTANVAITPTATLTLTNSLIQGSGGSSNWLGNASYIDGGYNLDSNPLFVLPVDPTTAPSTSGNLQLQADSPGIDTGDTLFYNELGSSFTDAAGNRRVVGPIDMGAYEFQYANDMYLIAILLSAEEP